jgi:hypothetical protein
VGASSRLDDHPYLDRRRPQRTIPVIAVNHVPGDLADLVAIGRFASNSFQPRFGVSGPGIEMTVP